MALARIRGLTHYESSDGDGDSEDGSFEYEDSQDEDSQDENSQDEDSQDEDSQDEDSQDEDSQDEDSQDEDSQDEDSQDEDSQDEDSLDDNFEYGEFEDSDSQDGDFENDETNDPTVQPRKKQPARPAASQAAQDTNANNTKEPTIPLKHKQKPIKEFADIEHLFTFPPFTFSKPLWQPPFHNGSRAQNRAELLRYARALGAVDPESDIAPDNENAAVLLSAPINTAIVQRITDVLEACKRVLATVEDDLLRTLPRERFIARDIAPQSVIACGCWNNRPRPDDDWGSTIPRHHRCFAKDRVRSTPWSHIKVSVVRDLILLHQRKQEQRRAQNEDDNGDNGGDWVLKLQHNKSMLSNIVDFIGINYVNTGNLSDNLREDLDASTDAERYCCQLALSVMVKYRDFLRYPAFLADFEEWKRKKAAGDQVVWPMRDASGEPLAYHANVRVAWDFEMAWDAPPAVDSGGEEEAESQPCPSQANKTTSNNDNKKRGRSASQSTASNPPASSSTIIIRRSRKKQVTQERDDSAVFTTIEDEHEETIGDEENEYDHEMDEPSAALESPAHELPLRLQSAAPSTQRERSKATKKDNRKTQTTSKLKKKKSDETSRHSTLASQQKRDSRGRFLKAGTSSSNDIATAEPSSSPAAARTQTGRSASRAGQGSRARGRGRAPAPATTTVGGGNDQASPTDQPSPAVATKGRKTLPQRDASGRWIKDNSSS